jgi:hypothetical protein
MIVALGPRLLDADVAQPWETSNGALVTAWILALTQYSPPQAAGVDLSTHVQWRFRRGNPLRVLRGKFPLSAHTSLITSVTYSIPLPIASLKPITSSLDSREVRSSGPTFLDGSSLASEADELNEVAVANSATP